MKPNLFGIELEMFYINNDGKITVPPLSKNLPLDGCGAIVELRSEPTVSVYDSSFEVKRKIKEYKDLGINLLQCTVEGSNRHKFTIDEFRLAGKQSNKDWHVSILNLYGKKQRMLPKACVAIALQINFSKLLHKAKTEKDIIIPAAYGLIDVVGLVKGLDIEFKKEIEASLRVTGEYAIKDNIRLEYRSLPSSVFFGDDFESRVNKVINAIPFK